MKETIYYITDKQTKTRRSTVCLLNDGHNMARGVAVCHMHGDRGKRDQFDRKKGLAIARGRALKAINMQHTCKRNNIRRRSAIITLPHTFISKCEFEPVLTAFEQKLITPPAA